MTLWLVRHAHPVVAPGVCYGAWDVGADGAATQQAAHRLAAALPAGIPVVASPLQRCEQLTQCLRALRPDLVYSTDSRLVEMDFGRWEGQRWDALAPAELQAWTDDFSHWRCGGAESVQDFMSRVAAAWDAAACASSDVVWITHAGVIRAAQLLARGVRLPSQASQWPQLAPAWGEWLVLACHP